MKKAPKTTMAVRDSRVQEVYNLLINGKNRPEVLEFCSKKFGLKRASADSLLQEANRMIGEDIEKTRESSLGKFLKQLEDLYQRTVDSEDFSVARQVIMDQAKLLGLEKTKISHSFEDKEFSEMSDEDLDRELSSDDSQ